MSFSMKYYSGHPAGYTDDLGIIADENQWVAAEYAGWYCNSNGPIQVTSVSDIYQWCKNNIRNFWNLRGSSFYFEDEKDAMLFMLRWGGK